MPDIESETPSARLMRLGIERMNRRMRMDEVEELARYLHMRFCEFDDWDGSIYRTARSNWTEDIYEAHRDRFFEEARTVLKLVEELTA